MPGLTFSNELISRDEGLHVEFAVLLYSMIKNKLTEETVHGMFEDAIEVEKNFIIDSIPCAMLGMNSTLMTEYIQFVGGSFTSSATPKEMAGIKSLPLSWIEVT